MHIPCNERACQYYENGECKLRHAGVGGNNYGLCQCFYFSKRANT